MFTTHTRISGDYVKSTSPCYGGVATRTRISSDYYKPFGRTLIVGPSYAPICPVITPTPVFVPSRTHHYTSYSSMGSAFITGATLLTLLAIIALVAIFLPSCHVVEVCEEVGGGLLQCHLERICTYL